MARRRNNSTFEDFIVIAGRLPWWLSLLLAVVAWFGLHALAMREITAAKGLSNLSLVMIEQIIHGVAMAAQYVLPLLFVAGAFMSLLKRWRRRSLFNSVDAGTVSKSDQSLSWQQFEQLTGETFRRRGFQVTENDKVGADGGIDLVLQKDGEKYLVQCKQWRASKVDVSVVRELYGVMAAGGAAGGFVVTSGRFTKEASEFAKGRNVELIDGVELQRLIQQVGATSRVGSVSAAAREQRAPTLQRERVVCCPRCQSTMVRRTAKRGTNAGNSFWGCSRYPDCRGTQQLA